MTTLKKTKDKAWKAFSLYVRNYYSYNGGCECFTCGRFYPIGKIDAGHGIPGRSNAVLFLEEVVRPQCQGCNRFKHGVLDVFTRKLIDQLGIEEYDIIKRMSKQIVKYTINDYLDIEKKYKEKLEKL